jgi:peptidoglycan/LPS O-acetylase OafA/YrhL
VEYLANGRASLAAHTDANLLAQTGSIWVLLPVAYPWNEVNHIFAPLRDRPQFANYTTDLRYMRDDGNLVRASVSRSRSLPQGPEEGCGTRVAGETSIPLDGPLIDWVWTLQLNYFASQDGALSVRVSEGEAVEVPVEAGLHQVYVRLVGGGDAVVVEPQTEGLYACVGAGPIGIVVPSNELVEGEMSDMPAVADPSVVQPPAKPAGKPGKSSLRVASWTGLRAFAAVMVMVAHAAFWTGHYTSDAQGLFFSRFEMSVPVFFSLSGFLLFRTWVRAAANRQGDGPPRLPSLRHYFLHRFVRVLPAYWVAVTAIYIVYHFRPGDGATGLGWEGFLRNMTLTQIYGWGWQHQGLTQTWSLAVEATFYLLLPILGWAACALICRKRWRPELLIAFLSACALVTPVWIFATQDNWQMDKLWLPGFVDWFLAGMVIAVAEQMRVRVNSWLMLAFAAASFALACTWAAGEPTIVPNDPAAAVVKSFLYLVFGMSLLAAVVLGNPRNPFARLLGSRPVAWVGEISYELFLVHLMILEIVMYVLGYGVCQGSWPILLACTLVASLPIAWALHWVVGKAVAPLLRN